ncbi:hypothetical protein NDU88_007308 [Pleurodeles waltl]|uniref:Uncharacterized protein n=1 Tax=Pleurodeles waltl TaxID=8319 RepID=A0AAV7SRY2_PLEWA|nr:hypothetical protein NDU88_007308 [Pleurodeles waltl]
MFRLRLVSPKMADFEDVEDFEQLDKVCMVDFEIITEEKWREDTKSDKVLQEVRGRCVVMGIEVKPREVPERGGARWKGGEETVADRRSDGWLWRGGWDVLRRFVLIRNKHKKYFLPALDLHYDSKVL